MNDKTKQLKTVGEPYSFGDIPTNMGQALKLAEMIANSNFAPEAYRGKTEDTLLAMQLGAEVGLKPLQAVRHIAVIKGTPTIYGNGMLAIALSHPDCEDIIETYDEENRTWSCTVKRKGYTAHTQTFSWEEALAAKLTGRGAWAAHPKRMLQWRARRAIVDRFADALNGLGMREEYEEYAEAQETKMAARSVIADGEKEYTSRLSQMSDQLKSKVGDSDVIDVEDEAIEDNIVIEDDTVVVDGLTSDIEMTERYATRMKWLNGMIDKSNADNSFKLSDKHIDAIQSYIQDEYASPSHLTDIKNGAILLGIE